MQKLSVSPELVGQSVKLIKAEIDNPDPKRLSELSEQTGKSLEDIRYIIATKIFVFLSSVDIEELTMSMNSDLMDDSQEQSEQSVLNLEKMVRTKDRDAMRRIIKNFIEKKRQI